MDRTLEKYLRKDPGFFVELGAYDGVTASNTYHLEYAKGWRGVLIEPSPHLYLECLRKRSRRNNIFCNACVSFDYTDPFVEMTYCGSMSIAKSIADDVDDIEAHLHHGRKFLGEEVEFTFGAKARTLGSILAEADAPQRIDFLSLDVEGAEIEVLEGVDLSETVFEHMLIACRDLARLEVHLDGRGYRHVDQLSPRDHLFMPA